MALIVEDGTGKTDSESYVTVAAASARLSALGDTSFAALASDALREQALRKATNYMEQRYRLRWRGTRLLRAQALSWPRYGAVVDGWDLDSTVVPPDVSNACADLALLSLTETLNPNIDRTVIREKVGPLETEYAPGSPLVKRWSAVEQSLTPYFKMGAMSAELVVR
jgi:hypothetical protein